MAWEAIQWSQDSGDWDYSPDLQRIYIHEPGTYYFYATTGGPQGTLQAIDFIALGPLFLGGPVEVHVVRDPNTGGGPGCTVLGGIDLHASPGTLGECWIVGNLGSASYAEDVNVDELIGPLDVGGNADTIRVTGDVTGPVTISGTTNKFQVDGGVSENLFFAHAVEEIVVSGAVTARIDVAYEGVDVLGLGEVGADGEIGVNGNVALLLVGGAVDGRIDVLDNVTSAVFYGSVRGTIYMLAVATMSITGSEMSGQLLLDGIGVFGGYGVSFAGGEWTGDLVTQSAHAGADIVMGPNAKFSGNIAIQDTLDSHLKVYGAATGDVTCGRLRGTVELHEGGEGPAELSGYWDLGLVEGGELIIGDLQEPPARVYGVVRTSDFPAGSIKIVGALDDPNDNGAGGHIIVDGAFGTDDPNAPATIDVFDGFVGETEFVSIDFYARLAPTVEDRWGDSAVVSIDGDDYYGNAPAARVYLISRCKGDADGDADVDYYDIDPLLDAFGDGAAYNAAFPGLSGSRVFHCDIDCSGTVDFYDIDPFIARLGTCTPECYEYDSMQGGGEGEQMQMMGGGAAAIAAQLAASVSPENMPALIAAIEQLALNPPVNSATDWSAVLAALAGV